MPSCLSLTVPVFAAALMAPAQPPAAAIAAPRLDIDTEPAPIAWRVRSVPTAQPVDSPARILCLGSNPSNQARLALTREVEAIDTRLRAATYRDSLELVQHWEVATDQLQSLLLRYKPRIVHFSGHGAPNGELQFQRSDGTSDAASVPAIAELFGILDKYVSCVVLNACFSERQARDIAKSVDVVIGVEGTIDDGEAIAFSSAFYGALACGEDVETAFRLGRNQMRLCSRTLASRDFDAAPANATGVKLFARPGVDPARIRFCAETTGVRSRAIF
jgi:hypothetical protein